MSEILLDRVAKAIADQLEKQSDGCDWDSSRRSKTLFGYIDFGAYDVIDLARAAIEALRPILSEIRKELADNAADLGGEGYFRRSEDVSRLCDQIDAALARLPEAPP